MEVKIIKIILSDGKEFKIGNDIHFYSVSKKLSMEVRT